MQVGIVGDNREKFIPVITLPSPFHFYPEVKLLSFNLKVRSVLTLEIIREAIRLIEESRVLL